MANFVYVCDGEVTERYDILPDARNNVSGIRSLSKQDQIALGFYPVIKDEPVGYDHDKFVIKGPTFTIHEDYVHELWTLEELSEEEQGQRVAMKKNIVTLHLRELRDRLLLVTDWTQIEDANPPGGKDVWVDYRQQLRDVPTKLETEFRTDFSAHNYLPTPPVRLREIEQVLIEPII